jgi:L-seryl-tRNA(Ser) seleniumtransferase
MTDARSRMLRALPSVSKLIGTQKFQQIAARGGVGLAKLQLRAILTQWRDAIRSDEAAQVPSVDALMDELAQGVVRAALPEGRHAINATGILLHTGLGRAPLCRDALDAIGHMDHYSVLQTDLQEGKRSLREEKVQNILVELTGCEAACVVNNNAAATMLILHTLAARKEVIVSRGQLIEIGGSFRIPDVMAQSGAILREVGTTNRTHLRDYESAISEQTAAILHVHTSNYRIRGFTASPSVQQLAQLAHSRGLPAIDDVGSGALVPLDRYGLANEPLVAESIRAGADICCFSGDKLISGPQSGIILGNGALIQRIRKSPFARMFRVCKMTLAALETTLGHFLDDSYLTDLPLYRMLGRTIDELEAQAQQVVKRVGRTKEGELQGVQSTSYMGSGSAPDEGLPTVAVSVAHARQSPQQLARRLRGCIPSVFGHIQGGAVLLDMRTVLPDEIEPLAVAVRNVLA